MGTTLPVLRRSAIQSAKSCLYRYNQLWNLGVPDDNEYSLRGIGFHSAAHRYIRSLVDAGLPSDEDLAKLAFVEGIATALTPAPLVPEIHGIFTRWAELFQLDLDAYIGAEEHQRTDTEHTFTPDLVYARPDGLEIVDFKTFFHPMTEVQVRDDWQARWYMFAARKVWKNFPSYRFTHSYVRLGKLTSVVFGPNELDGFTEEVAAVAAVIQEASERNEWPATPGEECRFCQLQCPVVDNAAMKTKRLVGLSQAQKAGELILAGEQLLKTAKGALKAYVAVNGPVSIQGMAFDNRPVLVRTYPIAEVLKVLTARNIAGGFEQEGLTISHSALSKLFKQFGEALEKDLLPFQQSKTTYRFSAKKPGVGDDDDGD